MDKTEILSRVDHTLLKSAATWDAIKKLCSEAVAYHTASVCIPPSYVKRVRNAFPSLTICTVVGFPLGYATLETKVFETENAIKNGADEIDMVVNLGDVKNRDFDNVTKEIIEIKKVCGEKVLKVIIETCYLTTEEKIKLCRCVAEARADYIKTSTGFGSDGATPEDIRLFQKHLPKNVKIKAAGGIRSAEDFITYLELGCHRIGASAAISALEESI